MLHIEETKSSTVRKGQKFLGFCNSNDVDAIAKRREMITELKYFAMRSGGNMMGKIRPAFVAVIMSDFLIFIAKVRHK
jgi:hypothetical protein